jgi:endonuclease III related protein
MAFGKQVPGPAIGSGIRLPRVRPSSGLRLHWVASLKLSSQQQQLRLYYRALLRAWGRQHWWPARTRFEVIVGAYLTQNTAWTNVERALRRLRAAGLLSVNGIRTAPLPQLEAAIRSAGYFRQKARRLKLFVAFLDHRYHASLSRMFASPTGKLREELLALEGIGPETADSILLYAGQMPVFVVDAYTRRVLDRHGVVPANASYEDIRSLVELALARTDWDEPERRDGGSMRAATTRDPAAAPGRRRPPGAPHPRSRMSGAVRPPLAQVYNEMHALIVGVGKHYCLKSGPRCEACPLRQFLPQTK